MNPPPESKSTFGPAPNQALENAKKTTNDTTLHTKKIKKTITCPICLDQYPVKNTTKIRGCKHSFCSQCLSEYLNTQVDNSKILMISCPQSGCRRILPRSIIRKNLDKDQYKKYITLLDRKVTLKDTRHKFCPKIGCSRRLTLSTRKEYTVCGCGTQICNTCTSFRHEGRSCLEVINPEFELYSKDNRVRFCIICKTPARREGGCPHMTCPVCEFDWCWICGREFKNEKHICPFYWSPVSPNEWQDASGLRKIWLIISKTLAFPFELLSCLFLWPLTGPLEARSRNMSRKKPFRAAGIVLCALIMGMIFLPLTLIAIILWGLEDLKNCLMSVCCGVKPTQHYKAWRTRDASQFRNPWRYQTRKRTIPPLPVANDRQINQSQQIQNIRNIEVNPSRIKATSGKVVEDVPHIQIDIDNQMPVNKPENVNQKPNNNNIGYIAKKELTEEDIQVVDISVNNLQGTSPKLAETKSSINNL